MSSSIPSWQILTAHAQSFRGARDLVFCLKVPLDSLLVWASSGGSGETARMRRLAWTFAAHTGNMYQIGLTQPNLFQVKTITKAASAIPTKQFFCCCFFLFGFYGLSRLFHSLWAKSIVRWGKNGRSPEKKNLTTCKHHVTRARLEPTVARWRKI